MSTKQLYEKTSEGMKEVSPLVAIEDIYSKLSDTPLEALVSLYNHVKCEWKGSVANTRRTVPLFLRRSGLFITYNNGTKYVTEFFSAGTNQITTEGWVKDSNWTPVPDKDYISAGVKPGVGSIGYEQLNNNLKQLFREKVNVTNYPDDEDIASVDNMLKFKDRETDAANFQSKGYVILRKNLVEINGVVKNILTKDMINKTNCIYEIRYDFDLNGNDLTLPQYSTLKFCGGSLKNGSLNLYRCNIQAPKQNQIFDNVNIFSTTIYPEWFGAKGDGSSDDSDVFNYIGNLYVNIELQPGKTYILKKNVKIIQSGTSFYIPNYTTIKASSDFSDTILLTFRGRNPYGLFGNKIYGNGTINGNCRAAIGISVAGSINTLISDIQILDCKQNGLRCRLDSNPEQYGYDGAVVVNNLRVYNDNVEGSNEGIAINLPDSYLNNSIIKGYKVGVSVISSCVITNVHVWKCDTFATCYGSPVFQNAYSDECKVVFDLVQSGIVNCNGLYWYNDSNVENEMSLADIRKSVWTTLKVTNIYEQPNKPYNLIKTKELANHCIIFIDNENSTSFRNYDFIVNANSSQPFYKRGLYSIREWVNEGTYYVNSFTNQIKQELSFWNIDEDSILIVKIKSLGGNVCIQDITFINSNKRDISNAKRIVNNNNITYLSITTTSDSIINSTDYYLNGTIYTNKAKKIPYIILGEKKRILYTDDYDNKGASSNRPQLESDNECFEYYDTTLKKKILWNGTTWVNIDGSSLDVKKNGTTKERPTDVEIGFIYKDTTLNKLIVWDGTTWVSMDGTELAQ